MTRFATMVALFVVLGPGAPRVRSEQDAAAAGNVVLITLDGARTEEIFGGLDLEVLKSTLREDQKPEDSATYRRFWAASPEERRQKLMPFFWSLVTTQGSIAGNHARRSTVALGNGHWFSYPGYAEILLGEPHDQDIKSNDPIRNPYTTVLERIRERLNLTPAQVATFASWSVFNAIVEHTEGATTVNAGVESWAATSDAIGMIDRLQRDVVTPWDGTRFDAFTFRLAMAHMAAAQPRVLYLAFDETDDWAHDGRYDRVLDTYARFDGFLKELWEWIDSQPAYRGRTHLLITTDHGRGHSTRDWRNHGARVQGSRDVWMAFVSPRMTRRGEWRDAPPLSTSQIAATLASWMNVDWTADHPNAGKPIQ